MTCPFCGATKSSDGEYCGQCGREIPKTKRRYPRKRLLVTGIAAVVAFVAVLVITAILWPAGKPPKTVSSTETSPSRQESSGENEGVLDPLTEQVYNGVLAKYTHLLFRGEWPSEFPDISILYAYGGSKSLSEIGYALMDLDQNGQKELLVGHIDEGRIWDLYTIVDGKAVHLFGAGPRCSYEVLSDGRIYKRGGGGVASQRYNILCMEANSDSLRVEKCIAMDIDYAQEIGLIADRSEEDADRKSWFVADGTNEQQYYRSISKEEADRFLDEMEAYPKMPIVLIPLSDHPYVQQTMNTVENNGGYAIQKGSDMYYWTFHDENGDMMYHLIHEDPNGNKSKWYSTQLDRGEIWISHDRLFVNIGHLPFTDTMVFSSTGELVAQLSGIRIVGVDEMTGMILAHKAREAGATVGRDYVVDPTADFREIPLDNHLITYNGFKEIQLNGQHVAIGNGQIYSCVLSEEDGNAELYAFDMQSGQVSLLSQAVCEKVDDLRIRFLHFQETDRSLYYSFGYEIIHSETGMWGPLMSGVLMRVDKVSGETTLITALQNVPAENAACFYVYTDSDTEYVLCPAGYAGLYLINVATGEKTISEMTLANQDEPYIVCDGDTVEAHLYKGNGADMKCILPGFSVPPCEPYTFRVEEMSHTAHCTFFEVAYGMIEYSQTDGYYFQTYQTDLYRYNVLTGATERICEAKPAVR